MPPPSVIVPPLSTLQRSSRVLAACAIALWLGACGQKGPLYLPNAKKAPITPTAGAATPAGVPPEATPIVPAGTPQPQPQPRPQTPEQQRQQQQQEQRPGDSSPAATNSAPPV